MSLIFKSFRGNWQKKRGSRKIIDTSGGEIFMSLKDKTALITGGTKGIGEAVFLSLIKCGCEKVITFGSVDSSCLKFIKKYNKRKFIYCFWRRKENNPILSRM